MASPIIYDYLDYRSFLRDIFRYRKKKEKFFSYRYFAKKSGFASPNFLKLVADGKRNLSNESVAKIARGFGLKKEEREFFESLVFMNQAKDHEERNHYYKKMMSVKGFLDIHKLEKAKYEYFSKWYYPVIREVAAFGAGRLTPADMAKMLSPKIKVSEARQALKALQELDLIKKDDSGCWVQVNKALSTGPEVTSLVIANYHREMMKLGAESLERYPAKERDISAVTISANHERMDDIKKLTASYRKQLLEMACDDDGSDRVFQVCIQVFPVTRKV